MTSVATSSARRLVEHGISNLATQDHAYLEPERRIPTARFFLVFDWKDGTRATPVDELAPLTIGRGGRSEIILNDVCLSREHARVVPIAGGVRIEDLGSRNGIVTNGERVRSIELVPGERVLLGNITLTLLCTRPHSARLSPESAAAQNETRRTALSATGGRPESAIVVSSERMRQVHALARRVASGRMPVLVLGESGTGKELVAREVHDSGERRHGRSASSTAPPSRSP